MVLVLVLVVLHLFANFFCSNDNLIPANNTADIKGARLKPSFLGLTDGLTLDFGFFFGVFSVGIILL
jgi:hypothetical protein